MQRLGKYEILGEIGTGGLGIVYRARDSVLDREVALKGLPRDALRDGDETVRRFLEEAKAAGGLAHPNIVVIYELGLERGIPYIAMEYLPGRDLRELIAERTPLSLLQKVNIAIQVARALHFAHGKGVLHRSLKPSNIRILPSGVVKVVDFAIAKVTAELPARARRTGIAAGISPYESPEHVQAKPLSPASDIFCFGVVLQELLTWERPFAAPDAHGLQYQILHGDPLALGEGAGPVPEDLSAVIRGCLKKSLRDRFASFEPILAQLTHLQQVLRLQEAGADAFSSAGPEPAEPHGARIQPQDPGASAAGRPRRVSAGVYVGGVALGLLGGMLVGSAVVLALTALADWFGAAPASRREVTPRRTSPSATATPAPRQEATPGRVAGLAPTPEPSASPAEPSLSPTPPVPTQRPTSEPTKKPTPRPTRTPTPKPTPKPTATIKRVRSTPSPGPSPQASPAVGVLSIASTPWAYVRIDGAEVEEQTPLAALTVPAGEHRLRLERDGYYPIEQTITISPTEPLRLAFSLKPLQYGSVTLLLSSPDWAFFKIDGGAQREFPHGPIALLEGRHTLSVYRDGYRSLDRVIEVRANADLSVSVKLEAAPAEKRQP
jgi:serine/threonine-protein kinase